MRDLGRFKKSLILADRLIAKGCRLPVMPEEFKYQTEPLDPSRFYSSSIDVGEVLSDIKCLYRDAVSRIDREKAINAALLKTIEEMKKSQTMDELDYMKILLKNKSIVAAVTMLKRQGMYAQKALFSDSEAEKDVFLREFAHLSKQLFEDITNNDDFDIQLEDIEI